MYLQPVRIKLIGIAFVALLVLAQPQMVRADSAWNTISSLLGRLSTILTGYYGNNLGQVISATPMVAFPGALGFGANTSGARAQNASTCIVRNLNDSGAGSFRACAEQSSPAYITFAVSGYILLQDEVNIGSNKTIECATAPGDGVVFRRARLHIAGNDVIVRGCRVWPGSDSAGQPLGERDGITVGNNNRTVKNVMVANNSVMFSTDEGAGTWYPVDNVTFQDNILSWPLNNAGNPEGAHSMNMLIGDNAARVTAVGNFYGYGSHRNPQVKVTKQPIEVINNLVYCYGANATNISDSQQTHVINNVYKSCAGSTDSQVKLRSGATAYVNGNIQSNGSAATVSTCNGSDCGTQTSQQRFVSLVTTPLPASSVAARVLLVSGPTRKTALENLALDGYRTNTGKIIDNPTELGGFPQLISGTVAMDTDSDGMSDVFETTHCGGSCAATGDHDRDGYENIEEYFHTFYATYYGLSSPQTTLPLQPSTPPSIPTSTPAPTPAPTLTLTAQPRSITSGETTTLSWSSTNTQNCIASGAWSGTQATTGTFTSRPITTSGTPTFTLTCTGTSGRVSQSASVTVAPPNTSPQPTIVTPYKIGDRVKMNTRVNVRTTGFISPNTLIGVNPADSVGTIIAGPTKSADGIIWFNVQFDAGYNGWVGADNYRSVVTSTPLDNGGTTNTIFSDSFDSDINWTKTGLVNLHYGSMKNGVGSVEITKTGTITKTIPVAGFNNISVAFTLGTRELEAGEYVYADYYNGSAWVRLITEGNTKTAGTLTPYTFTLPSSVTSSGSVMVRFGLTASWPTDYAYIDDVVITGTAL